MGKTVSVYKAITLYKIFGCVLFMCGLAVGGLQAAGNSLLFDSRYSTIKIYQNATLAIDQPITLFDGTLVKAVGAGITGSIISFNDGILEDAGSQMQLSGIFDPTGTIKLIGNNTCRVQPGMVLQNVTVAGVNNKLEGQPVFASDISFLDSLSTLSVALQSQVNKNIVLTGGTLLLQNDLSFTDSARISGNGTIDGKGYKLITGGVPFTWDSNLAWNNLSHLYLNTNVDLTGSFTFRGQSSINGNGYILDLRNGGSITVASGATLDLADLVIDGLGSGGGQIFFVDDSSRITVSNCTFDLIGSFTTSTGEVKAKGPMTVMVKSFTWNFNGTGDLIADGVTVWKDKGSASPCGNIIGNITLSNSGRVSYKKHKDDCDDDDDNGTSCCSVLQSQINVLSTSTRSNRSIIDVLSTSTTTIRSIVDSLSVEIESCCDASAACCSINDAKIESVSDIAAACCSANEALILSCCDTSSDCCSVLDAKIESVQDMAQTCCSINEALSLSCCESLQSQIDVVSTSTTKLQSIVDSLGSEIESCCDASAECCSTVDAKIESVADIAAACCSITDAKIESVVDMLEECCSASEECCSLLDAKIESVTDRLEECCSASEVCCSVLDTKIESMADIAAACCSANEALILSCCDTSSDCCSVLDAKIESVTDMLESCCDASAVCCSVLDTKIESVSDAAQVCCSINDAKIESVSDAAQACCSANEALILSCCDTSSDCCSVLDAKIESVQDMAQTCCSINEALSLSCCESLQSQIDVVSTSTTKLQSIVDSLGSEIESCCDASAVCCSTVDAKIESVQDTAQACCSTVDAKIESVADIAAVCCSITDAKIESVVDMPEECCSASEECCSLLDAKIESVTDRLEECCSASEVCCSVLDVKIDSLIDAVLQSALDCCANTEAQSASCCDAIRQMAEECCSANEALTLSCCDAVLESALDCCSANEALMLSCCEITEQCCSQSEALLSCCEEAAQCCSVNEALLNSCCDASLQCCSLVDAKIESCCEASAECCSVLDAKIESVADSAAECCSETEALALSCCEEVDSRLDELENAIGLIEDELASQEVRIEDLELITGSSVTTVITADGVFTSDMLPKADETRIIKFAPEFQGRNNALLTLTIDPELLDDGGLITLPSRSRLQFEGLGVVEILDGVTFNFQGSLAPRTRLCVLEGTGMMGTGREDWPELMFSESVVAIADGATVNFGGEGSGFISIRQGAQLLVNMDSHVIFGENSDAELDILFDENSMLTIDHPAALVTFQHATFDIVFDQNSECTIAQGVCEFNTNQGVYAPGFIRKLYMVGASTLNVQRLNNNAGRLELAPNSDNSLIDFDNEDGTITGEGDIRYRSFDAQAVDSTLQIQPRNIAGTYATNELFIGLAALQEGPLEDTIQVQLGTLGNDASGQAGQEIVGQAGNPAALCPELSTLPGFEQRSGRIVALQAGDNNLFYDVTVPGGELNVVAGLDSVGNVFRITDCDETTRV